MSSKLLLVNELNKLGYFLFIPAESNFFGSQSREESIHWIMVNL